MTAIDYTFRFNTNNESLKPIPLNAENAKRQLELGNQTFAKWMTSCQQGTVPPEEARFIIECGGFHTHHVQVESEIPRQDPFAIVIGCSDARVPIEMLFGQGFNDLFVIRVAGNVLADECWGSIDYAVTELSKSLKLIVVMGHSSCGAVTAAVDAYLDPKRFSMETTSFAVRSIIQHIFIPVHRAARGLATVWGPDAPSMPGYRRALIESSVCLNAAAAACNIRVVNERLRHSDVRIVYGVYDLQSHHVQMPPVGFQKNDQATPITLADAPMHPSEYDDLAIDLAKRFKC